MKYSFNAFTHPNITANHQTTFMLTKDDFVTSSGDCIVGIKAEFELEKVKEFIRDTLQNGKTKASIIFHIENNKQIVTGTLNPDFDDDTEMVARTTDFLSKRTLMTKADKNSVDLRSFVTSSKDMTITLDNTL